MGGWGELGRVRLYSFLHVIVPELRTKAENLKLNTLKPVTAKR